MKVIKATQQMLETRTLVLGFQGENLRTQLRIDCSPTFAEYPNATPALAVKPSSGETYPVFVERDGNEVVWDIVANNLVLKGDGELQLTFYKDNVIAKTVIGIIRVNRSLQIDGEMPDVVATWIENANRKLAEVDAQIVELEGMVDTATDAATRAQQSESNATTAAANAATSAATATEKATEATNAAGTATAKAAEAALSATQASNSAVSAADSERGATAKAAEAAQSAQTAAQKAEQITEAAQIATGKAEEASASARAAQESATDAAASATAASESETAAKASETAAGASATQAATSAQTAGTAAQTATQKAAEATQSATDAATFAGTATTKAEEAAASAQAASDAKTAVEQTAEQLADSLEQIAQNTQDIAELDERKANVDGYYPDMTVGNAEQLNSSKYVENSEPYTFRTSGGSSDIGNREYLDAVVGGTLAWNQAVRDEASTNETDFADVVTVTDAVEDAAGVKVQINPVQDLHGYDHPWPAGGGNNLWGDIVMANDMARTVGASINTTNKTVSISTGGNEANMTDGVVFKENTQYTFIFDDQVSSYGNLMFFYTDGTNDRSLGRYFSVGANVSAPGKTVAGLYKRNYSGTTTIYYEKAGLFEGVLTASQFSPYSNICPITGWDGVKVTRTGKNLFDKNNINVLNAYYSDRFVASSAMRTVYIKCKPNTIYIVSNTSGNNRKTVGYTTEEPADRIMGVASNTGTIMTGPYAKYLFVYCYNGNNDTVTPEQVYDALQIELGSTVSDYEPYAGQTYPITLPSEAGTVYGGELTVNADGSGSLVVDKASVDLGTLNWVIQTNYSVNRFGAPINDMTKATSAPYYDNILCSAYKPANIPITSVDEDCTIARYNGWVYLCDSRYSDVATFKDAASGVRFVYPLATPTTYTLTAAQIRTLLGQNNVWADTGDLALTYTGTDEHLTLESGKKYLTRISGTDSMLLGSGQEITAAKGTDNVFDLTQMFGTAVADYVYGQGAAFFRKWFGKQWYPYNTGELLSVEGLQSHDMVGFNVWDEEWEVGRISTTTGGNTQATGIRSKNFIPVLPLTAYFLKSPRRFYVVEYDASKNFVRYAGYFMNEQYTTSANAHYIRFYNVDVTTYSGDICISLAHNGSRNGEYEPYEKHSYPLDSSVILRGIPKVGANGVYWDGDRYLPDGTVERRYGVVDLGTLNWTYQQANLRCWSDGISTLVKKPSGDWGSDLICPAYRSIIWSSTDDKFISLANTGRLFVKDTAYTDAAAFKSAMSGVYLVYELATPTIETAQPYHSTQWVSDWGTEEFVSTGIVPVGHETRYPANLRDKLQHLPDAASGNGSYLITQTDGQMVLTPFPAPPSTAGNYVLKATVVNGVATYTWEVAT